MSPHVPLLAMQPDYRWFDWLLVGIALVCLVLWLSVVGADLLSSLLYRSRKLYTDIIEYVCLQCGRPAKQTYATKWETALGPVDFAVPEWRDTLLRNLQDASEVAGPNYVGDKGDGPLIQRICDRLGDLVRRTAELSSADQRRQLVDQIKLWIAAYPE
jgi:hypothetical protein